MAMFIVCMYTLLLYLDRNSSRAALLHGACCAVLVDIRIMGVFVPAVTLIALAYRMAAGGEAGSGRSHVALNLAIFCAARSCRSRYCSGRPSGAIRPGISFSHFTRCVSSPGE